MDEQDDKGRWIYRKKDNSTWGYTHMAWTYTRWIRTFHLVKDALPPASRAKWEKGLLLGYKYIAEFCSGTNTHNIAIYLAAGLYVAGISFEQEEWKNIASKLMHRLVISLPLPEKNPVQKLIFSKGSKASAAFHAGKKNIRLTTIDQ